MATKVYGESDDLVEFTGDVDGEVSHWTSEGDPMLLILSDGTLMHIRYGELGIWKFEVIQEGECFERIELCSDPDAHPHSDVAYFRDGLKWAYSAQNIERVR